MLHTALPINYLYEHNERPCEQIESRAERVCSPPAHLPLSLVLTHTLPLSSELLCLTARSHQSFSLSLSFLQIYMHWFTHFPVCLFPFVCHCVICSITPFEWIYLHPSAILFFSIFFLNPALYSSGSLDLHHHFLCHLVIYDNSQVLLCALYVVIICTD